MTGQESLWSALEVQTQAAQCRDQITVWDLLEDAAPEVEPVES